MKHFILLLAYSFCAPLLAQEKMRSTRIDAAIKMELPASLQPMEKRDQITRYVSANTPIAMYSSEDQGVDFGINTNQMPWVEGEETLLKRFYKRTFQSLFDEIEYVQDTVEEINGKKFIVFEFISTIKDENAFSMAQQTRNYTYIQYTNYKKKILLFNFSCKPSQMKKWQPIASEMMHSIQVKK